MISKLASYAVAALLLTGTVGGQEQSTFGGDGAKMMWVNNNEKGQYLLVYYVKVEEACRPKEAVCMNRTFTESRYRWFPSHEAALAWANESNRVSAAMMQGIHYVISLRTMREDGKWIIKP